MSISLNNHETRITTLENKPLTITWALDLETNTPNTTANPVSFLDFDSQYDLYFISAATGSTGIYPNPRYAGNIVCVSKSSIACHQSNGLWYSDVMFNVYSNIDVTAGSKSTESLDVGIKDGKWFYVMQGTQHWIAGNCIIRITALKLYYNFSYNICCLICTFLEFLFKEV